MTGGSKDDYHQMIVVGFVSPAIFALAGTLCLLIGKALVPAVEVLELEPGETTE